MINFKSIKQKKRITLLLIASFSVVLTTWSQNKITGLVKDSSGELPGVSVSVEGNQSIGTITDNRGEFSISVPTTAKKPRLFQLPDKKRFLCNLTTNR